MKKMSTISTNSAPSGKLFSLGAIEFSNVASTAFVEILIDTLSHNDGASSYFKKTGQLRTRVHDAGMRLNNCNELTVVSSLRIFSVAP